MAQLCPVVESEKDPSDTFFWWLCDTFGNQKEMLESFESNMGTYSHIGTPNDPLSNYIAQKQNILTPYTKHPNQTVQNWAKKQIESIQKDVEMHKKREEYRDFYRIND